ncbi:MAG: hypothetical protein DLM63_02885 [Solirubrobacterales bacterium]|nr:MAG: hypothetical protein DLM63_02885 [Solirubrobacterales bacterium]
MYRWDFGGVRSRPPSAELEEIHQTRLELIERPVRAALAAAGSGATGLDLACSEGWFAHRLLDWGASQVLGVDIRPDTIHRAELIRNQLDIPASRLELRCGDLFTLDIEQLGEFDVVLMLGVIYHVEDPVGALRRARRLTRRVCAIESQLTRQDEPIEHGWGGRDSLTRAEGSFATRIEQDRGTNPLASQGDVMSLIPNWVALQQSVQAAGFSRLWFPHPRSGSHDSYRDRDRAVVIAWPT